MYSKRNNLFTQPRFYQTCLIGISSIATLTALALINPPHSYVLADTNSSVTRPLSTVSAQTPVPQVTRTIQAVDQEGNVLNQVVQHAEADPLRPGQSIWPDYFMPRIEGYYPSNNQAQQVMPADVNRESHDEIVKVKYKKGDGVMKKGTTSSVNFAWVWYDTNGQQQTAFYPNQLTPSGVNAPAPAAPKHAKIVSKIPKSFYIYPGMGVTYHLRIQPVGIEPQTKTITRTINLELPDGTHQIKKQALTFHQDVIFNEDPAGFKLTAWIPTAGNVFNEYQLPEFQGYTCGQTVVPKLAVTKQLLEQSAELPELNVSLVYHPVAAGKPSDQTPPEQDQPHADHDQDLPTKPSTSDDATQTDPVHRDDSDSQTDDTKKSDDGTQTDESQLPTSKDEGTQTDHHQAVDQSTQTDHSGTIETGTQTDASKKENDETSDNQPSQSHPDESIPTKPSTKDGTTQSDSFRPTGSGHQIDESKQQESGNQGGHSVTTNTGNQTEDSQDHPTNIKPSQPDQSHKNQQPGQRLIDHQRPVEDSVIQPHGEGEQKPSLQSHQSKPVQITGQHQAHPSNKTNQPTDRPDQKGNQEQSTQRPQQTQPVFPEQSTPDKVDNVNAADLTSDHQDDRQTAKLVKNDQEEASADKDKPASDQPVAAAGLVSGNQDLPQTGNKSSNLATFASLLLTVLLGWLGLRSFRENDHQPK